MNNKMQWQMFLHILSYREIDMKSKVQLNFLYKIVQMIRINSMKN